MPAQHTAVVALEPRRRCSRCHLEKPLHGFYRNPASICKRCHNAATARRNEARRAALARLVYAYPDEYRRLLAAERARRAAIPKPVAGPGGEAA
jgi:hypothetical protein